MASDCDDIRYSLITRIICTHYKGLPRGELSLIEKSGKVYYAMDLDENGSGL